MSGTKTGTNSISSGGSDDIARLGEYMERAIRARYGWTGHAEDLAQVARLSLSCGLGRLNDLPANLRRKLLLRRAWCDVRNEARRLRRQEMIPAATPRGERQTMAHLSVRLPRPMLQSLSDIAAATGEPVSVVVRRLLQTALDNETS